VGETWARSVGRVKISERAAKWAQWPVLSIFHNITTFMICTMGMWILKKIMDTLCRPKKTCPLFVVRGLFKKRWKRPYETIIVWSRRAHSVGITVS